MTEFMDGGDENKTYIMIKMVMTKDDDDDDEMHG